MLDQMRSGANTHAADDDFEWVNDWATASARPDKIVQPQLAARREPAAAAPSDGSAVAAMDAPPPAEPTSLNNGTVIDSTIPVVPLALVEEVDSAEEAVTAPASTERATEAVTIPATQPPSADAIGTAEPIPQSPAEVETLPLVDTDVQPSERRPWTSLFRLMTGAGSGAARDESAFVTPTETVAADAPAVAERAAVPVVQEDAAEISLAPDQLERDIAEIEQVRDQLLSQPEPDLLPAVEAPRSRTSDLVPILVGAALGFILLVVFGAAASFVSLR